MTKTIAQKLFIKTDYQTGIFNAPDEVIAKLAIIPTTTVLPTPQQLDAVILFVNSISDLQNYVQDIVKSVKYDGLLWIAYPKKSAKINTDIDRDHGWEAIFEQGLRAVANIAIDDMWSTIRFRPIKEVKVQKK